MEEKTEQAELYTKEERAWFRGECDRKAFLRDQVIPGVDYEDQDSFTALYGAVLNSRVEDVKLLLELGANPNHHLKPRSMWEANTPLFETVLRGNHEIFNMILNNSRTDIHQKDSHGRRFLQFIAGFPSQYYLDEILKRTDLNLTTEESKEMIDTLQKAYKSEQAHVQKKHNNLTKIHDTIVEIQRISSLRTDH